ncbi:hypothetical protein TNCV_2293551 [Trichonephila clavipes]|nr:hypothetical protein TNCV_2293551 [Trichonephila clavipes]
MLLVVPFFNFELEWTIHIFGINTMGTILNKTVHLLTYANDIVIIPRTKSTFSFVNPTPLAHADTQRDNYPRGEVSQPWVSFENNHCEQNFTQTRKDSSREEMSV